MTDDFEPPPLPGIPIKFAEENPLTVVYARAYAHTAIAPYKAEIERLTSLLDRAVSTADKMSTQYDRLEQLFEKSMNVLKEKK